MSVTLAILGIVFIVLGGLYALSAAWFGAGGLFDPHQPNRRGLIIGVSIWLAGIVIVLWGAMR